MSALCELREDPFAALLGAGRGRAPERAWRLAEDCDDERLLEAVLWLLAREDRRRHDTLTARIDILRLAERPGRARPGFPEGSPVWATLGAGQRPWGVNWELRVSQLRPDGSVYNDGRTYSVLEHALAEANARLGEHPDGAGTPALASRRLIARALNERLAEAR